ncbi:glycosyltransferase family 4 protein [Dinoroseobacter sp. PD6]|uniref:glycosyltransferase family 4 protein n=1 Tax=Dinoroseobacter sp. PD6 TaxID=3028384 RepID=UPI00237AFC60|nr:glycosyltransferase family 4 protein [Dinoroseobacter sp. PD6]MDD9715169.1 glycosyltransferase family 4 protein [Dinoroseobacter sp. PD6]
MRVAYVSTDPGISPTGTKGASIHMRAILGALLRMGAEVTLFAPPSRAPLPEDLAAVTWVPLPKPAKGAPEVRERALIAANACLAQAMEDHGPFDLIYERHALFSDAAMQFGAARRIPSVLEVNAPLLEEQRRHRVLQNSDEAAARARSSISAADRIIAVSDAVGAYAEGFGARSVKVVPNGVDADRFAVPPGFRPPFTLGFVGTLKPWHDVACLIDALALVRRSVRDARLLVVGDGPERPALEAQAREGGLVDAVDFHGAAPSQDIPALLARMHVGLAPYRGGDPFYFSPLKIYEYMAAGLPVLVSDRGNMRDVVLPPRAGAVVPPDDPAALAEAIVHLAQNPSVGRARGQRGRAHVIRTASWDHVLRASLDGLPLPSVLAA